MTNILTPLIFLIIDLAFYQILGQDFISILTCYFVFLCFSENIHKKIYSAAGIILIEDFISTDQIGLIIIPIIIIMFLGQILRNSFKGNIAIVSQFVVLGLFISLNTVLKSVFLGQNISLQSTLSKILINMGLMSLILLGTWGNRFLTLLKRGKSGLQTGRMPYKV